jgi:hypothetical protein
MMPKTVKQFLEYEWIEEHSFWTDDNKICFNAENKHLNDKVFYQSELEDLKKDIISEITSMTNNNNYDATTTVLCMSRVVTCFVRRGVKWIKNIAIVNFVYVVRIQIILLVVIVDILLKCSRWNDEIWRTIPKLK